MDLESNRSIQVMLRYWFDFPLNAVLLTSLMPSPLHIYHILLFPFS